MSRIVLLDAPSGLGLRAGGVEQLPAALRSAGLAATLGAADGGRVEPPAPQADRDTLTGVLNSVAVASYARRLADALTPWLDERWFPLVLGGDCSVLLGPALALRRRGRFGLLHVDGHVDFYQPAAEPAGEVASMDLALVTGRGPASLTAIDELLPYVRDEDAVSFAARDADLALAEGSQDIRATPITLVELPAVRAAGAARAAHDALQALARPELEGFWIHLDADVLDDAVMPAVDYRMPGGLSPNELSAALAVLLGSGRAVGMTVTIYNPLLDAGGDAGRALLGCLAAGCAALPRPDRQDAPRSPFSP